MASRLETSFSSKSAAAASDSGASTPLSAVSTSPTYDSQSRASSFSSAIATKGQLAIKPAALPAATGRLGQTSRVGCPGAISAGSVMSPNPPQSPAAVSPLAALPGNPGVSITSKEWVIPPRPKPGRKPATDTPPTKRKAQNRAAQRAFRERRAARVGELEDQLEDQKHEQEQAEQEYQKRIRALETEVQVLRNRCQVLENQLDKEKTKQPWVGSPGMISAKGNRGTIYREPLDESYQRHLHDSRRSQGSQASHEQILSPIPQKVSQLSQSRRSTASSISSTSHRGSSAQPFSISQIISPPETDDSFACGSCNLADGSCACANNIMAATSYLDCGKCSLGSKCACLEESMKAFGESSDGPVTELKRPHPPASPSLLAPDEKKTRHDHGDNNDNGRGRGSGSGNDGADFAEVSFTHTFSRPQQINASRTPLPSMARQPQRQQQQQETQQQMPSQEIPLKDKCGFCSDGTYCACADAMNSIAISSSLAMSTGTVIAQQKTPPPSESDGHPPPMEVTASGAIKLINTNSTRQRVSLGLRSGATMPTPVTAQSSCGAGGPGTCAQCLADPVSGLFCRSLAANFERQGAGSGAERGCCGGGGPGGCCKNKNSAGTGKIGNTLLDGSSNDKAQTDISLSCADAYRTLASHRHFDEATDEMGTWLPKLRAAPRHNTSAQPATRHPMEVEAASIMSVLKGFDVRFGK